MQPDFIYVGASKSGSTWFYEFARRHSSLWVPVAKDSYYFDRNYDRGVGWYSSLFSGADNSALLGEVCHDYLHSELALSRIAKDVPDCKLICFLRNPYDRAVSVLNYWAKFGYELSVADLIKKDPNFIPESLYFKNITTLLEYFPRDQLFVGLFDDLKSNPIVFSEDIQAYLRVPLDQGLDVGRTVNAAATPRSRIAANVSWKIAQALRAKGFASLVGALKRSTFVQKTLFSEGRKNRHGGGESYEFPKDYILRVDEQVESLSSFLGCDLDHWLSVNTPCVK